MDSIPLKRCTKCKQEFPATIEYFYKQKDCLFGLTPTCKTCIKAKSSEYRNIHPEKVKTAQRNHYQGNKETIDARNKEWVKTHPAGKRAIEKRYREKHPKECHDSNKQWLDKNPHKKREYTGRRRNRKANAEGFYTATDIRQIHISQKGLCWWCGCKLDETYEIDHRIPISRGGTNWPNNIVLSCRKCNRSKSGKLPNEWSNRLL